MEGGGSIGKGWKKGGTGRLGFFFCYKWFTYFNKRIFLILILKQCLFLNYS